jgi:Ca2+-binding EF-hand superfamily protein
LDLLSHDKDKSYLVDGKEILKVIERRAKIPEYLKESEDLLVKAICEFKDPQSGKINYKDFVESLRGFNYEYSNNAPKASY